MLELAALRTAIELVHMPSRARALRHEPLPAGVPVLLEIAAGEAATLDDAARVLDRPEHVIRQAAAFFIEQVLLSPESDSYRILGASPAAAAGDLRRNMALLLRWLHPDVEGSAERSMLAGRVTQAWEDLKTAEKRAAYDLALTSGSGLAGQIQPGGKATVPAASPTAQRFGVRRSAAVRSAQLLHAHARDDRSLWQRALSFLLRQGR